MIIRNIQSDKLNIIRYLSNQFKILTSSVSILNNIESYKQFQSIRDRYLNQFKVLINSIQYNNDNRIKEINKQIEIVTDHIQNILQVFKTHNSVMFLTDILIQLISYLENKFSDLLKIDIIDN